MNATVKTKQDLMKYFAAIGGAPGRLFSLRDFNAQVMMNAYAPAERDSLEPALAELCAEDVLTRNSATDYFLSTHGLALVHGLRGAIAEASPAMSGVSHEWLRNPAFQDAIPIPPRPARAAGEFSFKVTFFEWRSGTQKRAQRLVDIDATDRGAAVKLATATLSAEQRDRYAVLRVVLNDV